MKYTSYRFILPLLFVFAASCASLNKNSVVVSGDKPEKAHGKGYPIYTRLSDQGDKNAAQKQFPRIYDPDNEKSGIETEHSDFTEETEDTKTEGSSNGYFIDTALELCETAQDFWQKGELENALEALDQAYELIIKVDSYDKPILTQQKDDLRFMISKRILEIYASRNIVVNGNHNAIPLTINEHVQHEIDLFTKGRERNFFIESYKRSGLYRPRILEALKNAGLPEELSWLPLIESGFKVNALSSARALGLWQFIPSTGYKFGLKRDHYIDERLDFEKSTVAAIAYMKELHQIFGDWATVLAAYNCGEGRVLRVIRTQNVNYLDNFWDLYTRLPRETARYVPRFLATLHVIENLEKYDMDTIEPYSPLDYETVTLNCGAHVHAVAKAIDISEKNLKSLNPELRNNVLPGDAYTLRVPVGKSEMLIAKADDIPDYSPPAAPVISKPGSTAVRYHKVRRGEALSLIAKRYGVSMKTIANLNRLNRKNFIVAGQTLKIPATGSGNYSHKRSSSKQVISHEVRAGDSLWVLARKYGTTTEKIKELNRLKSSNLYIGQVLKIASNSQSYASVSHINKLSKYRVTRGDTPFSIAKRHNMSVKRFLKLNKLHTNSKIYPGQTCYIE
ncbi:MAG: LysM peptidoglycan-binding domain-containing protein [Desulfobacterales bacterium]